MRLVQTVRTQTAALATEPIQPVHPEKTRQLIPRTVRSDFPAEMIRGLQASGGAPLPVRTRRGYISPQGG